MEIPSRSKRFVWKWHGERWEQNLFLPKSCELGIIFAKFVPLPYRRGPNYVTSYRRQPPINLQFSEYHCARSVKSHLPLCSPDGSFDSVRVRHCVRLRPLVPCHHWLLITRFVRRRSVLSRRPSLVPLHSRTRVLSSRRFEFVSRHVFLFISWQVDWAGCLVYTP